MGDTLLAVPALRALRRAYSTLTLGAHAPTARLLQALGEIDRGVAFDDPSLTWVFDDRTVGEPIVAWMERTPGLIGAAILAPSRPDDQQHVSRYLLGTLAPLGIDLTWDDRPLMVEPLESDEILIHPGSGSNRKNWPSDRFAEVIRELNCPVRMVVGEADAAAATALEETLGRRLERLEHGPLERLAAHLAGSRAYLGNDSGVSHLAGLCGARTVALFGPTNSHVWRPIGPNVQVVNFEADTREIARLLAG